MAKRKTTKRQAKPSSKDDSKLFAFLATFLNIIAPLGFIIAIIFRRKDEYVKFYAKQSLILYIAFLILVGLVQLVKPLGTVGGIINVAATAIWAIFWILSWVYALSGEKKLLPLIGQYGEKLPF